MRIPKNFPVQPVPSYRRDEPNISTCGVCGRSWDDSIPTDWTPAPDGRCPFEYFHDEDDAGEERVSTKYVVVALEEGSGVDDGYVWVYDVHGPFDTEADAEGFVAKAEVADRKMRVGMNAMIPKTAFLALPLTPFESAG